MVFMLRRRVLMKKTKMPLEQVMNSKNIHFNEPGDTFVDHVYRVIMRNKSSINCMDDLKNMTYEQLLAFYMSGPKILACIVVICKHYGVNLIPEFGKKKPNEINKIKKHIEEISKTLIFES